MDLTTRIGRKQQGQLIQKAAEAVGLSLEELAREIGCSRALIYQYVSGGVLAQAGRLQKIAERTGYPLTFFYENAGAEPASAGQDGTGEPGTSPGQKSYAREELVPEVTPPVSPPRTLSTAGSAYAPPVASLVVVDDQVARAALLPLEELADAQETFGDTEGLLSTCERIVPLARQLGEREIEARAWLRTGNARLERGHHTGALPAFRVAMALFQELGNTRLVLSCRQGIGRERLSRGDTEGALSEFRQVASADSWVHRWQGPVSMAAVHEHLGQFRAALEQCEAAIDIISAASGIPSAQVEAARSYVISNQANVYLACGDFPDASRISQELLLAAERSNQRDQFIEALIDLAICQLYQGEWDLAEENFLRAMDLARFSGDQPRWGLALAWRASLLSRLGDVERAKVEAKDALRIGLETSSRRCEIQAQISLAETYLAAAAPGEAIYHIDQAIHAAATDSSLAQELLALQRRSAIRLATGEETLAFNDAELALKRAREHGIQHVEAMAQEILARIRMARGDSAQAFQFAADALNTSGRLGISEVHWRSSASMAALLQGQGKTEEAIQMGDDVIREINKLRERILARHEAEALLEDAAVLDVFKEQGLRLLSAGKPQEAASLIDEAGWPPLEAWFNAL